MFDILVKIYEDYGHTAREAATSIIENNLQVGQPIAFSLRSSANVVIDTAETHMLQEKWAGNLEEYHSMIETNIKNN